MTKEEGLLEMTKEEWMLEMRKEEEKPVSCR